MKRVFPLALVTLAGATLLASCGKDDGPGEGTQITIANASGNVVAAAGKDGAVSVNVPGLQMKVDLPKIKLDADNFDMDGVKLYPGSKVTAIDVRADDDAAGKDDGGVAIAFDAPGDPAKVQDYFLKAFKDKGLEARADGSGVSGKDEDGKPFTITLTTSGAGQTKGRITTLSRQ
ncbi:MAG: hypothetical protein U5M50_02565 [Sphingobium sp.]|nr:hypothetical protein [Sphingobium sp.]